MDIVPCDRHQADHIEPIQLVEEQLSNRLIFWRCISLS